MGDSRRRCCCKCLPTVCLVQEDYWLDDDAGDPIDTSLWEEVSGEWSIASGPFAPAIGLTESGNSGAVLLTKGRTAEREMATGALVGVGVGKPRLIVNATNNAASYHYVELEWSGDLKTWYLRFGKNGSVFYTHEHEYDAPVSSQWTYFRAAIGPPSPTGEATLSAGYGGCLEEPVGSMACTTVIPGGRKAGLGNGGNTPVWFGKHWLYNYRIRLPDKTIYECQPCDCRCGTYCVPPVLNVELVKYSGDNPNCDLSETEFTIRQWGRNWYGGTWGCWWRCAPPDPMDPGYGLQWCGREVNFPFNLFKREEYTLDGPPDPYYTGGHTIDQFVLDVADWEHGLLYLENCWNMDESTCDPFRLVSLPFHIVIEDEDCCWWEAIITEP